MNRISKDEYFLKIASVISLRSTCLDKKVGCIIVNSNSIPIGFGYNGAPRGHVHCIDLGYCIKEVRNNPALCPSAHAEQNALIQCRVPEQIHTVYCTLSPCVTCIRMIMNTPCKRIVFLQEHKHTEARDLWKGEWIKYGNN